MRVRAKELKTGQTIRVEYGDYDNWKKFTIDEVHVFEKMILTKCHAGEDKEDFSWRPEEFVEVMV